MTDHPMLEHILALADPATWKNSLELADQTISAWLQSISHLDFERVYFVGCGSSLYNGQVGKSLVEHIARIPAEAIPAFGFASYAEPSLLGPRSLVVGISTTGGTQAVCDALAYARQAGSPTLAITAYEGSAITNGADAVVLTGGQDDTLSVKTKSYVQALVAIYGLAIRLGEQRGTLEAGAGIEWRRQVDKAGHAATHFLTHQQGEIQQLAQTFVTASRVFVFGSGPNLSTAEEASLKIVEMAKMHSSAHDIENFLHGRLREVDQANPLFFLAPGGRASDRVLDFLTVTDHIQTPTVVLTDEVTPGIQKLATHVVQLPGGLDEYATPLLYIIPMYLFGYEMARVRGYDPNARRYTLVPQNVRYGDVL